MQIFQAIILHHGQRLINLKQNSLHHTCMHRLIMQLLFLLSQHLVGLQLQMLVIIVFKYLNHPILQT